MLKYLLIIIAIFGVSSAHADESLSLFVVDYLVQEVGSAPQVSQLSPEKRFEVIQSALGGVNLFDNESTRAGFDKAAERIQAEKLPKGYKEKGQKAREILAELRTYVEGLSKYQKMELLQDYSRRGMTAKKMLKHGLKEVPAETARFATAIILVRIRHCFGGNLVDQMKWRADASDPICVQEIVEMLKSPLFYVGFAGFILASRATHGGVTHLFERNGISTKKGQFAISNLALAAGFTMDHTIQTLGGNEQLIGCAKYVGGRALENGFGVGNYIGTDREGTRHYSLWADFQNIDCKNFGRQLGSQQFWQEHFGMPMASLLASAGILSGLGWGLTSIVGQSTMTTATMVLQSTGPGRFAVVVGRLVIFLEINHFIEPPMKRAYLNSFVSPKIETYRDKIRRSKYDLNADSITKESPIHHSRHYTGFGSLKGQLRTRIPLRAHIESFRDYSENWRESKILGPYREASHRWQRKVDSFIHDFQATRKVMQNLVQARELKYTGKSDSWNKSIKSLEEKLAKQAQEFGKKNNMDPNVLLEKIKALHQERQSPELTQERNKEILESKFYKDNAEVYDTVAVLDSVKENLETLETGDIFRGLYAGEIDDLKGRIIDLIEQNKRLVMYASSGKMVPHRPTVIVEMLLSEDPVQVSKGLWLAKIMLPRMRELGNTRMVPVGPLYNEIKAISARLRTFDPLYPYEYLQLLYRLDKLRNEPGGTKTWEESEGALTTKNIIDHALVRLMCGPDKRFADLFGVGNIETFEAPQLFPGTNLCNNVAYQAQESDHFASVNRSFFWTEDGRLELGLFGTYLNAPLGTNVFNNEIEAGQWWQRNFEAPAMEKLAQFRQQFLKMQKKKLNAILDQDNLAAKILNGDLEKAQESAELQYDDVDNLGLPTSTPYTSQQFQEAMAYEMREYVKILRHLKPKDTSDKDLNAFSVAFGQLLANITSKNYQSAKKQCEDKYNQLETTFKYQLGYTPAVESRLRVKNEWEWNEKEIRLTLAADTIGSMGGLIRSLENLRKEINGETIFDIKKYDFDKNE